MNDIDRSTLDAILRSDFETFAELTFRILNPGTAYLPNWHITAICFVLDMVRLGYITRLIINMPPRHMKSILCSVAFPAFVLGHEPHKRIITLSYGADLSAKFTSDFRTIVTTAEYRRLFPGMEIERMTDEEIRTTLKGSRRVSSVGGPLTGIGGHIFILDDPQKAVDAQSATHRKNVQNWFSNTVISRLDDKKNDAIILVQQRVHMDDLSGYLISQSGDWHILNLAAIAPADEEIPIGMESFHRRLAGEALHPERESIETLEALRRQLGSDVFSAQYQQSPVPPDGAMIKRDWLRYYDELPQMSPGDKIIQSWDTASKDGTSNSWSVCTTWLVTKKGDYYLLDLTRGRFEYPQLKAIAIALAKRFKPNRIAIEDASTGIALAQELRQILHRRIETIKVDRDKIGRMFVQSDKFCNGHVFFPQNAAFLPELKAELLSFPNGKADDQVDSISQALAYKVWGYTLDNIS